MTSRILENIQRDMARWNTIGYCVVSGSLDDAQRADHKNRDGNGKENWQRTKRLKLILQRSPFSYKKVWGEYEGNAEVSYAIFPVSKDGERIGFDKLETFAKSLGNCFQQDTILVRKPDDVGGDTYYINAKTGEKDMEFENLSFDVDPASDFSTNVRNPKKPSHANHYFKYENIEDDSPRMNERRIAFYEKEDKIQDYLDEIEERGLSYKEYKGAKHPTYEFQVLGGMSSWAQLTYYKNGFYELKDQDMIFKGATLADFEQDLAQLMSVYESSDNSSPRMRESSSDERDLADKISGALGLLNVTSSWYGAGAQIDDTCSYLVTQAPPRFVGDKWNLEVRVGPYDVMALKAEPKGTETFNGEAPFDKLIAHIKKAVKSFNGLKEEAKKTLQNVVDFCGKEGYAGAVWDKMAQIDIGSDDEDEAEDLRYAIEDNFENVNVYVHRYYEVSDDNYEDLDEEIRDDFVLMVGVK